MSGGRRTRAQKQRAARARQGSAGSPADPPAAVNESVTTSVDGAIWPRLTRVSVALRQEEYLALKQFAVEAMETEGLGLVAGAEVVRALLALLRDDPALARRVRARLVATGGNRRG